MSKPQLPARPAAPPPSTSADRAAAQLARARQRASIPPAPPLSPEDAKRLAAALTAMLKDSG